MRCHDDVRFEFKLVKPKTLNLISFVTGLIISKKLFGCNEHEKLSNIIFRHTLKYLFHSRSHSKVIVNENSTYPKMNVKRP